MRFALRWDLRVRRQSAENLVQTLLRWQTWSCKDWKGSFLFSWWNKSRALSERGGGWLEQGWEETQPCRGGGARTNQRNAPELPGAAELAWGSCPWIKAGPNSIIVKFLFVSATFSCSGASTGNTTRTCGAVCQHLLQKEEGARKLNIDKGATSVMGQRHVGGQGEISRHYVNQAIRVQTQFY